MNLKKIVTYIFILNCFGILAADSTSYYLVFFKNKPNAELQILTPQNFLSEKALARRQKYNISIAQNDVPIDESYITQVANLPKIQIHNKSKWLNAVEIKSENAIDIKILNDLEFVSKVQFLGRIPNKWQPTPKQIALNKEWKSLPDYESILDQPYWYNKSFIQNNLINVLPLHNKLKYGNNVYVGVFDAGFNNAYKVNGMEKLLDSTVTKDFVTHDNSVWEDDKHGANCLSFMATYAPGKYIGTAPNARYLLCRTEEAATEYPTEEVNWLVAAEYADSCGVDMIVSSLGYNVFEDNNLSHTHAHLNGHTSIIAQAANIAFSKGIVVITSAGNEGDSKWHKIGTPADAAGVIAIGASDKLGNHVSFSSYGYSSDGRIKPDLICMGFKSIVASPEGYYEGNGTSYATPILAGAVACLMQAYPKATPLEIKNALQLSASHYQMPDTAYGYGLPDISLAAHILGNALNIDTAKDMMYEPPANNYWQQQTIHFKSSKTQQINVKILGTRLKNNKLKSVFQNNINLKSGEWFHDYTLHKIIVNQPNLSKRKKLKKLQVVISTQNATFTRVILF